MRGPPPNEQLEHLNRSAVILQAQTPAPCVPVRGVTAVLARCRVGCTAVTPLRHRANTAVTPRTGTQGAGVCACKMTALRFRCSSCSFGGGPRIYVRAATGSE